MDARCFVVTLATTEDGLEGLRAGSPDRGYPGPNRQRAVRLRRWQCGQASHTELTGVKRADLPMDQTRGRGAGEWP